MAITVNLQQLKAQSAQRRADEDAQLDSLGFIRLPNGQYVKKPSAQETYSSSPQAQENNALADQLDLQLKQYQVQEAGQKANDPLKNLSTDDLGKGQKLIDIQNQIKSMLEASALTNTGEQASDQYFERFASSALGRNLPLPKSWFDPSKPVVQASRKLDSERRAFAGNFARTLGGEAGVLTDVDIERILGVLPSSADTKYDAERKAATLLGMVQKAKDLLLRKAAGENVLYEPTTDEQFAQIGTSTGQQGALDPGGFADSRLSNQAANQLMPQLQQSIQQPTSSGWTMIGKK